VLKGINFDDIKFKYILVETNFQKEMNYFLESKKYIFVKRLSNYNKKKDPCYGDYLYRYNHENKS